MNGFRIEKFEFEKDKHHTETITSLLHKAYSSLAARGMKYLASHQPSQKTLERLNRGESYLGYIDDELISTITLIPTQTKSKCNWYNTNGVFLFGQFAVDPNFQSKGIGSKMMDLVESRAFELGAVELALDTSENAIELIQMYKRRGYRFIEYVKWDEVNYKSVILSKKLEFKSKS